MKILLFADLHMCPRASIINKWGTKYPSRLENCVATVNWLEQLAKNKGCDYIINLGDFFDRPDLTSETITACNDIVWSDIMHYSLVGNHDASTSSLIFNSTNSFLCDRHQIVTEPCVLPLDDCFICFLPYVVDCDRKPLAEYFKNLREARPVIILSHNDISGIQLGPVVSKTGFSVDEIEQSCDLFINGHLHNGQNITNKIINLGNITGKDFGEDASKYSHTAAILDTSTMKIQYVENPFALNFYKIQLERDEDLSKLNMLKNNAVVSVKCHKGLLEPIKDLISKSKTIIESRVIITRDANETTNSEINDFSLSSIDHLARFVECCKTNIDNSSLLEEELAEICK